jgi:hypothetical protein
MKKILLGLAALVAIVAPLTLIATPAEANPGSPGCVTRAEFKRIDVNGRDAHTRTQVTRIFGARGHVTQFGSSGTTVEYNPCAGNSYSYVDVDFDNGKAWFKWMYVDLW